MRKRQPFYKQPVTQIILAFFLVLAIYTYLVYKDEGLDVNYLAVGIDVALLVVGLFIWMAFFSQFVLPVLSLPERRQATNRLWSYLTGGHGPAIFINNGKLRLRSQEMHRRGPGVILLDTASAAVLRNPFAFTRPVGPGIVFTQGSEYLAGQVDLHIQTASLGPQAGEDPFVFRGKDEPAEAFERRQDRRYETSGLTRDGVEVVPVISANFKLISQQGEGGTMFGYNPESVWKAIASEGIDANLPDDVRSRHLTWDWLPVHLAVDLWREYLRKFTLNELFVFAASPASQDPYLQRKTAFQTIAHMVYQRLTQPQVELLDEVGQPTGDVIPSREYEILAKRGIQILGVSIGDLRFPDTVEAELLRQWKATWLQRSQEERKYVDRRRSEQKYLGEERAILDFAHAACLYLGPRIKQHATTPELLPGQSETLELLVRGTLNQSVRDPDLHPKLTSEKTRLVELIEWIRRN